MEVENSNPLVTVIVPLYNAEKYLRETINSVLEQTYTNWELIVIDDRSTDNSRDLVKEFENRDDRIKLIESETNFGGPARPRNIGIDNAKGEYIAFLDADDVWLPEKLTIQVDFLESNRDVSICHTLANVIDEYSKYVKKFNNQNVYNKLKYILSKKNILFYTNNININSVLMKVDKSLKFDEDKNLIALEDWKYWIDMQYLNKKIVLIDKILLNYRVHTSSISNRNTDIGYRKALYMLSKLFLKRDIPMRHYVFSFCFHILKLIGKNV